MATGTLSSPTISANGEQATFTVTGGTWAGTLALASATAIAFSLTCPTPSGGTSTRTVYAIAPVTASSGTITVNLSDEIFTDDTANVVAAADAIGDGTDTTAALTSTACTISSTLEYPMPTLQWGVLPNQRQTGSFDVYAKTKSPWGFPSVTVTLTDSASTTASLTETAETWVADPDSLGPAKGYSVHKFTFDATDFAAGVASIQAVSTPLLGTSAAIADSSGDTTVNTGGNLPVYLDPLNAQPPVYAAVDPTSTITTADDVSGLTAGETITQATSAATAVVDRTGSGEVLVTGVSGTPNATDIWTGGISSVSFTPTSAPTANGDDTNGIASDTATTAEATPCQTMMGALRKGADFNNANHGHNDADGVRIRLLKSLNHRYGDYSFPPIATVNHPVIIEAATGLAASDCVISSSYAFGINTKLLMFRDATVKATISDGASNAGSMALFQGAAFVGPGRTSGTDWLGGWGSAICGVNCSVEDNSQGLHDMNLLRGCSSARIGANCFGGTRLLLDCDSDTIDSTGTDFHPDLYIFNGNFSNIIISGVRSIGGNAQGIFMGGRTVSRMSVENVIHVNGEELFKFASSPGPNTCDNFLIENCSGITGWLISGESTGETYSRFWVRDSYLSARSQTSEGPKPASWQSIHNVGAAIDGSDITTGGTDATIFVDAAGGDYTPKADGPLVARSSRANVPRDLLGNLRATPTAIGAFAAAAENVLTAAAGDDATVTGTTATLAGSATGGVEAYSYAWEATTKPTGAAVITATGAKPTVTFLQAGDYVFTLTVTDADSTTSSDTVAITVSQTATTITVSPPTPNVAISGTRQFTAIVADQFGNAISGETIVWTNSGSGSIDSNGLYTAPAATGSDVVTGTDGSLSDTADVTIVVAITVVGRGHLRRSRRWYAFN